MTAYRRYRALYNFEARSDAELSMNIEETLTVAQLADGNWPPPEKWMQGYNEVTSRTGEFPGGAYVEFIEEFVIEPEPPALPEVEPQVQAPPLPPQKSPRHNSLQGFQLPGMVPGMVPAKPVSRGFGSQLDSVDVAGYRDTSPKMAPDDSEEAPPPPPPRNILRRSSDGQNTSRGSLPAPPPPKPVPRTKRVPSTPSDSNLREMTTPTHRMLQEEERHRWVSVTFGLPVQCAGCKLSPLFFPGVLIFPGLEICGYLINRSHL